MGKCKKCAETRGFFTDAGRRELRGKTGAMPLEVSLAPGVGLRGRTILWGKSDNSVKHTGSGDSLKRIRAALIGST